MAETPKIEFPQADYPIRVIADNHENLQEQIVEVMKRHDEAFREEIVEIVQSSKGSYCSVRVAILATGEDQLRALHEDLLKNPLVRLVL